MGYAEFGGTGSVKWRVEYNEGNGSKVHKENDKARGRLRGRGRDKDQGTDPDDTLVVECTDAEVVKNADGNVTVHVKLKNTRNDQVKLTWGRSHTTPDPDPDPGVMTTQA